MSLVVDLGRNPLVATGLGASFSLFGVITYTNTIMDKKGKNLLSKRSDVQRSASALGHLLSEKFAADSRTLQICGASFTELVYY